MKDKRIRFVFKGRIIHNFNLTDPKDDPYKFLKKLSDLIANADKGDTLELIDDKKGVVFIFNPEYFVYAEVVDS